MADAGPRAVRLAALGDLHYGRLTANSVAGLLTGIDRAADVLLLAGDLTDRGLPDEARGLVRELAQAVKIPIVAVLGNHDYEAGKVDDVAAILQEGHVHLLDGDVIELLDVGFAGVKGFCGGFGPHALGAWGEPAIKQFVQEAVSETLKLEAALARFRMSRRVALLHYAPVQATVEGEPPAIYPYLGSSRLEEPLTRFPVSLIVHGHAHNGQAEGRTANGTPVYNVALPLMRRANPQRPYRVFELPAEGAPRSATSASQAAQGRVEV
jgi:Icc-related predicted phosphoesterase